MASADNPHLPKRADHVWGWKHALMNSYKKQVLRKFREKNQEFFYYFCVFLIFCFFFKNLNLTLKLVHLFFERLKCLKNDNSFFKLIFLWNMKSYRITYYSMQKFTCKLLKKLDNKNIFNKWFPVICSQICSETYFYKELNKHVSYPMNYFFGSCHTCVIHEIMFLKIWCSSDLSYFYRLSEIFLKKWWTNALNSSSAIIN